MKIKNLRRTVLTFTLGAFFGISLIASYSFISNSPQQRTTDEIQTVDSNSAQSLTSKYQASASQFNDVLKGFTINLEQLDVMNRLNSENRNLSGFRIYLGENTSGGQVSVIYGVDQYGHDSQANSIYTTGLSQSGPCPPVCD
ncbi:MAG: hypothetical protein K9H64_13250 [Bacteroidales bacterium]|nr:hypothetical protein [Bacteroidales bacterium]MCF8456975.1 hypothetical protein [Bacteroidales bacterium]